ncbi:MAG: VanZ family protein [Candidatus Omnitrophica bacterium]|nr:VanZ family protein [Candidatus Omnitrophota bacterium]
MAVNPNNTPLIIIKYWIPVIFYAILIFLLSSIPGGNIPFLFVGQDAVLHIIEYGILAILLNRLIKKQWPVLMSYRRFFLVFFISITYGISDELHQLFIPNRYCSGLDLAFDGAGILMANIFYR